MNGHEPLGSEICSGLNMKYPSQVHVLNPWFPAMVLFWELVETLGGGL